MKTFIRKYLLWALIMGMGGVAFAAYMYNKPHKNIARAQPDFSLTAAEIYQEFEADEPLANERYLNKVISVKGQLEDIEINEKGNAILVLATDAPMGDVRCTMEMEQIQPVGTLLIGQEIQVKGICTGMLLDVILVQGVIIP